VIICGVDPGLNCTGYAVLKWRGGRVISFDAGVIRPEPRQALADRLAELRAGLDEVLAEHRPGLLAVETLYSHYRHPRTAIIMGHARGVILEAAASRGIAVRDFSATQIKQHVCAHGQASKKQVQRAIAAVVGPAVLQAPSDVADAVAVAICAAQSLRRPEKVR
jgi:crossover junction endodeoxyribonuclease RuvC